jgi:hypothetical protein
MFPKPNFARIPSALVALSIVLAVTAGTLAADEPQKANARRTAFNRPLNAFDAGAVNRAKARVTKKLQQPECQRVLSDFKDSEGRPLQRNLEKWGVSPAEYLEMIPFLDGSSSGLCRWGKVDFVSTPGVPRVFVCAPFAVTQLRDPGTAEAEVIHEMLHTLGLGENPPTSAEITSRVKGRCW